MSSSITLNFSEREELTADSLAENWMHNMDGNETSMKVQLHTLTDPAKQTNFENCVSDVNIPLGEVFTSPMLTGTQGILHVKEVYVEDYLFKDLRMVFKDGKVTEFGCGNFPESEEQGKDLVKQVISPSINSPDSGLKASALSSSITEKSP